MNAWAVVRQIVSLDRRCHTQTSVDEIDLHLRRLAFMKVLIVEDDTLIAGLMSDVIGHLGHQPIGPAHRMPDARRLIDHVAIDVALLDVNVAGELIYPFAEELLARGIAFAFTTGCRGGEEAPAAVSGALVLQKPFGAARLRLALEELAQQHPIRHHRTRKYPKGIGRSGARVAKPTRIVGLV